MRKLLIGMGIVTMMFCLVTVPAAAEHKASAAGPLFVESIAPRRIPANGFFIPPHVGGDRDFSGHGPEVFFNADLLGVGTNRLRVVLFMDAIETRQDLTHAVGSSPSFPLYVAPVGHCVVSVSRSRNDNRGYVDNDHAVDVFPGQVLGSFVREWRVVGDTDGNEAGSRTGVAISTFTINVDVQPC